MSWFSRDVKDDMPFSLIPGGEFLAGGSGRDEGGGDPFLVRLPAYYLAQHPVTNAQYARFLNEVCPSEAERRKLILLDRDCHVRAGTGGYTALAGKGQRAVVQVSWHGAQAYAEWAGLRLPSELEWERAAWKPDGRAFPIGASLAQAKFSGLRSKTKKRMCAVWGNVEVRDPWGLKRTDDSVWEWCADWYAPESYTRYKEGQLAPPSSGASRVVRGGSCWRGSRNCFRCACRHHFPPDYVYYNFGFRCAKNAFEPEERAGGPWLELGGPEAAK